MLKRYRYCLNPTPGQRQALARAFGCARVVYNDTLTAREAAHAAGQGWLSDREMSRRLTPGEADGGAYVAQRGLRGRTAGGPSGRQPRLPELLRSAVRQAQAMVGKPRFRLRRGRQSIRFTRAAKFKVQTGSRLTLPKVGKVRVRWSRPLPSEPSSVTVIQESDGRFYASFVFEVGVADLAPASREAAGVDLGLADFAAIVYADGTREKVPNPRYLRAAERRLAKAQRSLSRKEKGSRNRDKARHGVAVAHRKVRDRRSHHAHVLTHRLTGENQAVAVEDLNVTGLGRTRLAKSVHDAGWGQFLRLLGEKAAERGRVVIAVDRFAPSSQVCSVCGVKDGPKPLRVRVWQCRACGSWLDRDFNAAVNVLLAAGLAESLNACGGDVRLRLAGADPGEAGTHRPAVA